MCSKVNKGAGLAYNNEENKFAMKCNSSCIMESIWPWIGTDNSIILNILIYETSLQFRSVGTRNWLHCIRMHFILLLPWSILPEYPIQCPCGTLRSHVVIIIITVHCIVCDCHIHYTIHSPSLSLWSQYFNTLLHHEAQSIRSFDKDIPFWGAEGGIREGTRRRTVGICGPSSSLLVCLESATRD